MENPLMLVEEKDGKLVMQVATPVPVDCSLKKRTTMGGHW